MADKKVVEITGKLTDEQRKAIFGGEHKAYYVEKEKDVDVVTGEIIGQTEKTKAKTSSEPDFIKLYYKTMLAFNGADNIPIEFILSLSNYINYSNDGEPLLFINNKLTREQICKNCKIKESMYAKYIKRCVETGLLIQIIGYKGSYEVNPFFIAKGKWDSVKKLQTEFDYVNKKWFRKIEEKTEEETKQEENKTEG